MGLEVATVSLGESEPGSLFCTGDLRHKVSSEGAAALQTAFDIRELG